MNTTKLLLCLATLLMSGFTTTANAKCNPDTRLQATSLREQAARESDPEQAIYLLRSSSQLCEHYSTWMALGRSEMSRNDPDFAADYFYRARDMYQPDSNGYMSVGKLRRIATANLLLASALNDARQFAEALDALESSRRYFSSYLNTMPERLISIQASIEDGMSSAPVETLTRALAIQRSGNTRGVGIRVKPQEVDDEYIDEDRVILVEENLSDIASAQPVVLASSETHQSTSAVNQSLLPNDKPDTTDPVANSQIAAITPSNTANTANTASVATRLNIQVLFAHNSDQINETGSTQVARIATALKNLQLPDDTKVQIVGHTDITGSDAYNLDLSKRRASTVVQKIREKIPDVNVIGVGLGETEPRYLGTSRDDHRRNRRVEIIID